MSESFTGRRQRLPIVAVPPHRPLLDRVQLAPEDIEEHSMNHFGIVIGVIAATVIGGAVLLDQTTSSDKPVMRTPLKSAKSVSPATEPVATNTDGARDTAPVVADALPAKPAPEAKVASAAPETRAKAAPAKAARKPEPVKRSTPDPVASTATPSRPSEMSPSPVTAQAPASTTPAPRTSATPPVASTSDVSSTSTPPASVSTAEPTPMPSTPPREATPPQPPATANETK